MLDREGRQDLSSLHSNVGLLKKAISGVGKALSHPEKQKIFDSLGSSLALDSNLPSRMSSHGLLDEWYEVRLTGAQRQFVDHPSPGALGLSDRLVVGKPSLL